MRKGLELLATAARKDPGNATYGYVCAVALNDAGHAGAEIETLEHSITAYQYDPDSPAASRTFLD